MASVEGRSDREREVAPAKDSGAFRFLEEAIEMLATTVAWLAAAFMATVIGAALVYIIGFAVSMLVAMFYVPIEAIAHADIHMPHMHIPHMHLPHAA